MLQLLQLICLILLVFMCAFTLLDRICTCIERYRLFKSVGEITDEEAKDIFKN